MRTAYSTGRGPAPASRALKSGSSLFALALAASLPATAQAQEANAGLEEIVVEARRIEENLQRTPLSVTALSGDLLDSLNVTRVQELASFSPNLIISDAPSNGMGTIVYLRGIGVISMQASSDPPINIYVDGVVQARSTGNAFDLPDIDRVEVLRGPQGTLFGRNTTGSAIAIYTKRPSETFGGEVEFAYGRDNEINASFVVNTGELGDSGVRTKLTFGRHTRDGWVTTPGRSASSAAGYHNATTASFAIAADPSDKLSVDNRLFFNKLDTRVAYQLVAASANAQAYFGQSAALGGPPIVIDNGPLDLFYPDPRLGYDPQALPWGDTLTLTYDVNPNLTLKSITGYSNLDQKQTGQLGGSATLGVNASTLEVEPGGFVTTNNDNQTDQFTQELQAIGDINDFSYTTGLYYFVEDINENLITDVPLITAGGVANKVILNRTYSLKN